ncbi:MAG: hypothetical protein ACT4OV_08030 [Microthrixaceae bacterium]
MDEMRTLKRLLVGLALWSGLVVGISVVTSDGAPPAPATRTAVTSIPTAATPFTNTGATAPAASSPAEDHDNLQRDVDMTQRMSAPSASGPMFTGQIRDPQLDHSQNPAFIKALEEHQAEIDQMLARPTR